MRRRVAPRGRMACDVELAASAVSKSQSGSGSDQGRRATPSSATPSTTAATRPIHRCRPVGRRPTCADCGLRTEHVVGMSTDYFASTCSPAMCVAARRGRGVAADRQPLHAAGAGAPGEPAPRRARGARGRVARSVSAGFGAAGSTSPVATSTEPDAYPAGRYRPVRCARANPRGGRAANQRASPAGAGPVSRERAPPPGRRPPSRAQRPRPARGPAPRGRAGPRPAAVRRRAGRARRRGHR